MIVAAQPLSWSDVMRRALDGDAVSGAELASLPGYETPQWLDDDATRPAVSVCDAWLQAATLAASVDPYITESTWIGLAMECRQVIEQAQGEPVTRLVAAFAWELGATADCAVGLVRAGLLK